jgi:predicted DNA-binding transcriptional regulator AlpA
LRQNANLCLSGGRSDSLRAHSRSSVLYRNLCDPSTGKWSNAMPTADSNHTTPANDNAPSGDLLIGADAIARFLGASRRQTYRMIYDDLIPHFKVGGSVAARRSSLSRWMAEAEAA